MNDYLPLQKIVKQSGTDTLFFIEPEIVEISNVIVVPLSTTSNWGLFDALGNRILGSLDYRGSANKYETFMLDKLDDLTMSNVGDFPHEQGRFYFTGPLHTHYGHFITNFLSRLWAISKVMEPEDKLLIPQGGNWLAFEHIRESLSALGIGPERVVQVTEATVFERVVVAGSSFELERSAFTVFRELTVGIGEKLLTGTLFTKTKDVVYFSKTLLAKGAQAIENEIQLCDELEKHGVKVISPETMSFKEQIARVASARVLLGGTGSFFHTRLFAPEPVKVLGLCNQEMVLSNHMLVNKLTKSESTHFYSPGTVLSDSETLGIVWRLQNPEFVARELLEML